MPIANLTNNINDYLMEFVLCHPKLIPLSLFHFIRNHLSHTTHNPSSHLPLYLFSRSKNYSTQTTHKPLPSKGRQNKIDS